MTNETKEMPTLKPCPFCGRCLPEVHAVGKDWQVVCSDCLARTMVSSSREWVMHCWNSRGELNENMIDEPLSVPPMTPKEESQSQPTPAVEKWAKEKAHHAKGGRIRHRHRATLQGAWSEWRAIDFPTWMTDGLDEYDIADDLPTATGPKTAHWRLLNDGEMRQLGDELYNPQFNCWIPVCSVDLGLQNTNDSFVLPCRRKHAASEGVTLTNVRDFYNETCADRDEWKARAEQAESSLASECQKVEELEIAKEEAINREAQMLGRLNRAEEQLENARKLAALRERVLIELRNEREKLEALICHAIVHSAYRECGKDKMTAEQRELWDDVWKRRVEKADEDERKWKEVVAEGLPPASQAAGAWVPRFKQWDRVRVVRPTVPNDLNGTIQQIGDIFPERRTYRLANWLGEVTDDELEPAPWTLPLPPEGRGWHRTDWTEEMLSGGWRPLLEGEPCEQGDEVFVGSGWTDGIDTGFPMRKQHLQTRTKRPLPTPANDVESDRQKLDAIRKILE